MFLGSCVSWATSWFTPNRPCPCLAKVSRPARYGPQRDVEHGYYLRAHGQGPFVFDRRARLARALRARCGLLSSGPGRCVAPRPSPAYFQFRPGQPFISLAYEWALLTAGCRISRDGRGRATENAFIKRLWRTVKWEHIYLNPVDDGRHLHQQLHVYFAYYNHRWPNQSSGGQTPAHVCLPNQLNVQS